MTGRRIRCLTVVLATAFATTFIPASDAAEPSVSAPVGKAVLESHELIKQGKYDDALAKLAPLSANAGKNPQDDYLINRTRVAIAYASKNETLLATSLESLLASSESKGEERLQMIEALSDSYARQKNNPKTAEWLSRYFAEGGGNNVLRTRLARALYFQNDFAGAAKEARKGIDTDEAKGAVPAQDALTICLASSQRLNDDPTYRYALERLARYYPKKDYWVLLTRMVVSKPNFPARLGLDGYRFMRSTGQFDKAIDYIRMAEGALNAGSPAEARRALEQGFTLGVLGTGADAADHRKLLAKAADAEAAAANSLAKETALAEAAKNGEKLAELGFNLVVMGQADKGLALMEQGMKTGSPKYADDIKLHLALAYAIAGRKDEAQQMLAGIKAEDASGDLARYWAMHLRTNSYDGQPPK